MSQIEEMQYRGKPVIATPEASLIMELNNIGIVATANIYHNLKSIKSVLADQMNKILESELIGQNYSINDDYNWYASGELDTESFKGQHIAIWRKQVVGKGETPVEAERIAKAYYGNHCRPAVVYIPKDEEIDTIF
jgi:hypothetical protein